MLKIVFTISVLLFLGSIAFLFYQGKVSARQNPPSPDDAGVFPACSAKPNCVSSQADPSDGTHYVAPITTNASIDTLSEAVLKTGGVVKAINGNTLTATYTSSVFGFVDDLLMRLSNGQVHIRSSSRVGYSDLGANRKRVEAIRSVLDVSKG